jgi:hypothetical protein
MEFKIPAAYALKNCGPVGYQPRKNKYYSEILSAHFSEIKAHILQSTAWRRFCENVLPAVPKTVTEHSAKWQSVTVRILQ